MTTPADSSALADYNAQQTQLLERIRDIPDWPEPGVMFKDVTPLLRDPDTFALAVRLLAAVGDAGGGVDVVAGIEARGFIFGAPVAQALGAGFVPVRKAGKLPHETSAATYSLEYGESTTIEVHRDAFAPRERVLVIDDVLATGGTASATLDLARGAGAEVVSVAVLLELGFLHGREKLTDVDVTALVTV